VISVGFRVGRSDETAATSGKTHLVEHLALPSQSRRRIEFNGIVDNALTAFWASGDEEQARAFIEATARRLASLPVDRLETERQILLAEEATQGPNPTRMAFALRYGPTGHGLTGYEEYGLQRLTSDEISTWSQERFTRANAVIWLTSAEPGALELDLPDGASCPPIGSAAIPEVAASLPALYRGVPSGAVAFSLESERTLAFRIGLNVLTHRIQDRLRYELGLTYSVEAVFVPLNAERVHVVIVSDATDQNAQRVATEMLVSLEALAEEGPTEEELEDELADARRYASDRSELPSHLFYAAAQHLFGATWEGSAKHLEEQERLTAAEVASAIETARRSLLALVPESVGELEGLSPYPLSAPEVFTGRRFRPRGLRLRPAADDPKLVLGEEGVMIEGPGSRTAVRFDRCVAALRYQDGSRTLLSEDGFYLIVEPALWKGGAEIVAELDARVSPEVVVPVNPALIEQAESVERRAAEDLKRRWVVSDELEQLPSRLEPGEEIVTLCEAAKGMRAGLLVATDRRVIFFAIIRRETWLEFPYETVRSVDGSEGVRGVRDATVTIRTADEKLKFTGVVPRERAPELAAAIESRLNR
jgi:zinc protease